MSPHPSPDSPDAVAPDGAIDLLEEFAGALRTANPAYKLLMEKFRNGSLLNEANADSRRVAQTPRGRNDEDSCTRRGTRRRRTRGLAAGRDAGDGRRVRQRRDPVRVAHTTIRRLLCSPGTAAVTVAQSTRLRPVHTSSGLERLTKDERDPRTMSNARNVHDGLRVSDIFDVRGPVATATHKAGTPLSAAEISRLVHDYEEGMPTSELAKKYGIHRATVRARLRKNGVDPRERVQVHERASEIERLYEQGDSLATIGKCFGLTPSKVRTQLIHRGVNLQR